MYASFCSGSFKYTQFPVHVVSGDELPTISITCRFHSPQFQRRSLHLVCISDPYAWPPVNSVFILVANK